MNCAPSGDADYRHIGESYHGEERLFRLDRFSPMMMDDAVVKRADRAVRLPNTIGCEI